MISYGKKYFPEQIDITDPCYDKNVWCRINNFPISAGEYECYIETTDAGGWGERVDKIGIRKEWASSYSRVGTIGVDAGLAGFFANKPDYTDEEWMNLCSRISDGNAWVFDEGFFSSSGYGDGSYDVYAGYKDGEVVEVYIEFI